MELIIYKAAGKSLAAVLDMLDKDKLAWAAYTRLQKELGGNHNFDYARDGRVLGIRYDYEPLNDRPGARYAIPLKPIPKGWIPDPDNPGIAVPDLSAPDGPRHAETLTAMRLSDLRDFKAICGDGPAITISQPDGTYPRAYERWPDIFVTKDKSGKLTAYINAPVDYRGEHFVPADAIRVSETERTHAEIMIGHKQDPDYMYRDKGVALPVDYTVPPPTPLPHDKAFYKTGPKLKARLQLMRARQEEFRRRKGLFLKKHRLHSGFAPSLPEGSFITEHTPVQGCGFNIVRRQGPGFLVTIDTDCEAGRRIAGEAGRVGTQPELADFPDITGPVGNWREMPSLREIHGEFYLEFNRRADGEIHVPPDCEKMPAEIYLELLNDHFDEMRRVEPPPSFAQSMKLRPQKKRPGRTPAFPGP